MKKLKYDILFTILVMTIGMAAVTTNLVINGNTNIASTPDDFLVYFSDAKIDGVQDLSLVDSETKLVFDKELSAVGQSIVITYDVTNASKNYDAAVEITCTQSTEYLTISNSFDTSNNLSARSTKSGTLSITLSKSYTGPDLSQEISCTINASAVERTVQGSATVPDAVVGYYPMLAATYENDRSAFRSDEYRNEITKIRFEDEINIPADAIESWDISHHQDGSVMAYTIFGEATDLVIQSNGKVYANPDMSHWFADMEYIESINGLELLDTSDVTNMSQMFSSTGSKSENFSLDVSSFDTSKVTDMSYMFYETGYKSTYLTLDLGDKFDTSNVTDMSKMFYGTGKSSTTFTLDVSNFDTSKVTNMSYMFYETGYKSTNLTLDLGDKFDTSNVTDMSYMFRSVGYYNPSFTLDVSNFDTSKVTDMSYMFYDVGYRSTTFTLDVSNFDTSKVTDMSYMFTGTGHNSENLTLDVSNFDTSSVTNMYYMFRMAGYSSPNFTLDVSNFDTSKVTNMGDMFSDTGYNSTTFTLDVSNFDTSKVTNMSNMFSNTGSSSTTFTLDVSNFDTSKVTNMSNMFYGTGFKGINFSLNLGDNFDTSSVTNMRGMFARVGYSNPNFTLDLSNLDTSKVTDMGNMFYQTGYNSTKLNISITIRNKSTSYYNMFSSAAKKTGAQIRVNYTADTKTLVSKMLTTKDSGANVVIGYNESVVISFNVQDVEYSAYQGMTWLQWINSSYNTDGFASNGSLLTDGVSGTASMCSEVLNTEGSYVTNNDVIVENTNYSLGCVDGA